MQAHEAERCVALLFSQSAVVHDQDHYLWVVNRIITEIITSCSHKQTLLKHICDIDARYYPERKKRRDKLQKRKCFNSLV